MNAVRSRINSVKVSAAAAVPSVIFAFWLSYTANCTNLPHSAKKAITLLTQLPMLLPTITYGFAIIYSLSKQGLITKLFGGHVLIDIYGFNGLLIGYVIYTLPGMVLGTAFLFAFTGTSLQNTFAIIIVCNIVHYFATPYQMMKDSLSKMNVSWEITGKLMGDTWIKTVIRVITPNAWPTILQVFAYYFVNAMVTISAVVFLTDARTMVMTTQISALQHLAKFDDVFALSLLILATNLAAKGIIALVTSLGTHRMASKQMERARRRRERQSLTARLTATLPGREATGTAAVQAVSVQAAATQTANK